MKERILLLLLCLMALVMVADAQEREEKPPLLERDFIYMPYCLSYNMTYLGSTTEKSKDQVMHGAHFESPFFTFGFSHFGNMLRFDINEENYSKIGYGHGEIVDLAMNFPLKYARPSVGVSLWSYSGRSSVTVRDSTRFYHFSGCDYGPYFSVASAIPSSPVQAFVGIHVTPKVFREEFYSPVAVTAGIGVDFNYFLLKER